MKREDYISWDAYFMGVAHLSSERSKDPSTRVGAVIVNEKNRIVSVGYNGTPTNYPDDVFPWDREGETVNTKYPYVCHSELNCILNARGTVDACRMYVTLFPCNECAKAIIQAGITEVIYDCDKYKDTDSVKEAKKMFDVCGVTYRPYERTGRKILIEL